MPPPTVEEEVVSSQKNRKESKVWEYYSKLANGRVKCNFCPKNYAYNSDHGTTTLWKHLRDKCVKSPLFRKGINVDNKQSTLVFKEINDVRGGNRKRDLVTHVFDNDKCRKSLTRMIIKDELSFRFVDGEGFKEFCNENLPQFVIPSRWTVARDCWNLFLKERLKLQKLFTYDKKRVCLTTDVWTSIQNMSYMCLTAHFIDDNWNYQKRLISFCQLADHKGDTIGKTIESCLLQWGIENVFTLTLDNASANDIAISYMRKRLRTWKVELANGTCLHVRCAAHILNLVVNEGLKILHSSIVCIRNAIMYDRSSPSRLAKFKECSEKEKLCLTALVSLDVATRWNSTYTMLDTACKFQRAFERMEEDDGHYKLYFVENEKEGPHSHNDWENAKVFVSVLRIFYDVTLRLSGSLHVTSTSFFQDIGLVNDAIMQLCDCDDPFLKDMGYKMRRKFEKYWGDPKSINHYFFLAAILDPRLKLSFFTWSFNELYSCELANEMTNNVKEFLKSLYGEYRTIVEGVVFQKKQSGSLDNQQDIANKELCLDPRSRRMMQFNLDMHIRSNEGSKTEVERYLSEERIKDDSDNFDVLAWWKLNCNRFKILSRIARDVLAIPISTVASEYAFSTGGRILDQFRSSLNPKMVEALICAQDWLRSTHPHLEFDYDEFLKDSENWFEMDIGE